ncbi:DoxX family protein [Saccharothrix sp. 6-C]|uniref:DoxX family protein n=1 Tax=Saccharothrix sp. 6-C TaxID=2781735 RepID=UPI0019174BC4|nr:DoxX family protein [Saccharothrix sp. 6-C]QQQ74679.1 DoxX family protein [Saccharothrix sp. 6-C]
MDLALWIITGVLAAAYFFGGAGKLVLPKQKIAAAGPSAAWTEDWSAGAIKAIGALEVLGAVGLVLPAVLGIAPALVPVAATGLVVVMVGATVVRVRRRESKLVVVDLVYLALLAFVVWGRLVAEPLTG